MNGQYTRGMTVCDLRHITRPGAPIQGFGGVVPSEPANAEIGMKLDVARFFDLLVNTIAITPEKGVNFNIKPRRSLSM